MDLLAKRYASPFIILDEMGRQGRFTEFVLQLNQIIGKETDESRLWDIWLHKVYDQTYDAWRTDLENKVKNATATKQDIEATVHESIKILDGFYPYD